MLGQVFKIHRNQRGVSIVEMLVSLGITTFFIGVILEGLMGTIRSTTDHEIKSKTTEQARSLLDLIAYDLRVAGSGIPFVQSGFAIGDATLGDAPLPIFTSSSATRLDLRINERGNDTILTADYTPSPTSLTVSLFSTDDFDLGDTIYITDMTVGGGSGLRSMIMGVTSNSVTISGGYVATASSTFPSGSVASRVTTVGYNSPSDWSGVTRSAGTSSILLQPNSQFAVVYYDTDGNVLTPPLTTTQIKDSLASLVVTVSVQSERKLRNGTFYTAQTRQEISLRNLVLSRG